MNLRPPGPQPAGWGADQAKEPMFTGFAAAGCAGVFLNLITKLIPKRVFGRTLGGAATCRGATRLPAASSRRPLDIAVGAQQGPLYRARIGKRWRVANPYTPPISGC